MYWHWWLLIWMIDEIYVFTLVVSDTTDWCDWCIETGGSWYGWLMLWDWWFLIWPSNLHLSPNCWHGISNISMYIHLNCIVLMSHILVWPNTYCKQCPNFIPLIVGSIYPIQLYISINVHECVRHTSELYWSYVTYIGVTKYLSKQCPNFTPLIVGSIYPIKLYISYNCTLPNPVPEGHKETP